MKKIIILIATVALAATVGISLFYFLTASDKSQGSGNELTYLVAGVPDDLDTTRAISYDTIFFVDNLFRRLFRISGDLEYTGDLAQSWKVDEKNREIEILLKPAFSRLRKNDRIGKTWIRSIT